MGLPFYFVYICPARSQTAAHRPPPTKANPPEAHKFRPAERTEVGSLNNSPTRTTDNDENEVMVPAAQPIM